MSEENQEAASEVVDNAIPAESMEDIQNTISAFDDEEGSSSDFKSTASSPEADDEWDNELSLLADKMENGDEESNEDEEDASETDSEQQTDSDESEEEEADSDASAEAKDEPEAETTDKPGTIEVKTADGILKLTLDEIQAEHPEILQRLKNEVSGEKEIARRFSEFDRERSAFNEEKELVESYINQYAEATKDGNILGGLTYFAEFANIPPYLLKEQLIASLRPEIEKRAALSQDQINNMRLKDENDYLTQKNESDTQKWQAEQARSKQEQAEMDLQNQINSIRETHKVTDEEWSKAVNALDETLPDDVETIPLSAIQAKILEDRSTNSFDSRIDNLVAPIMDQVNAEFISELKALKVSHPDLTDTQIKTVIDDSLKIRAEKELKKNLAKKTLEKPKKVIPQDSDRSFDNLKDLVEWD